MSTWEQEVGELKIRVEPWKQPCQVGRSMHSQGSRQNQTSLQTQNSS